MMEIIRFAAFLVTAIIFTKVAESLLLDWRQDRVVDDVPEDDYDHEYDDLDRPDDLTILNGINEDMLPALNRSGFNSFSDVELADIAELKDALHPRFPTITDSELRLWIKQASLAVQGRWDELDDLKAAMAKARAKRRNRQQV